jgi:hypothetical protein
LSRAHEIPKSGSKCPWKVSQNYIPDAIGHRFGRVDDAMVFGRIKFPCAGGRWLLWRRPTTCTVVQYCSYGWSLTSTSVWAAMDVEEKFDDSRLVENFGRG